MDPFNLKKEQSAVFDGHLITRIEGLLSKTTHRIRRRPAEPGILAFSADVFDQQWDFDLDLDGEPFIRLARTTDGEVTEGVFPVESTRFDKTPAPLPRSQGELGIPERLAFRIPGDAELPGDDQIRSTTVEVHFFNGLPVPRA